MNRKKVFNIVFYLIILVVLIYIFFLGPFSFYKRYQVKSEYQRLQTEYEELKQENERLKTENEALKNDEKVIEKKAREFGMQKENEEVFIFQEKEEDNNKN
ncbi:MAG: cell division protein FtsL [Candidatus Cloacimonadota bacterium]|nr:cell division protein FtsL [Candidatus Cloacimonadota bacterium]